MPKLPRDAEVSVKVDGAGAEISATLTEEQLRGLWEHPGSAVVAIVELRSVSYSGYADGEEKPAQVKLRVVGAEVARTGEDERSLREAYRAMWRARKLDGTLDEVGPGPRAPGAALAEVTGAAPSEDEYQEHRRQAAARARTEYVR